MALSWSDSDVTYTHVFCVRSVRKVLGHLRLEEAILMPLGPDGRLRAQSVLIEELLVLL